MNELKTKENIIGMAVVFVLLVIALYLISQKYDMGSSNKKLEQANVVEKVADDKQNDAIDMIEETEYATENTIEIAEDNKQVDLTVVAMSEDEDVNPRVSEKYVKMTLKEVVNGDSQMAELYSYWDQYRLDAVADLIRLERVRAITDSLDGTKQYYYYGDTNAKGLPEGKGLAVYEDNTYYFGSWKNGLRDGDGMWLRIYPDGTGVVDGYQGVREHQYSGQWKNDLPNGDGQEHFTYEPGKIGDGLCIANAMGSFRDGYYNGDMLLMVIDIDGSTQDWYGFAVDGVFNYISNEVSDVGTRPVWTRGANGATNGENPYYLTKNQNTDWGISSLER